MKAARRLPGVDEVLLPGERGNRLAAQRLSSGILPLPQHLLQGLRDMAKVTPPSHTPGAPAQAQPVPGPGPKVCACCVGERVGRMYGGRTAAYTSSR